MPIHAYKQGDIVWYLGQYKPVKTKILKIIKGYGGREAFALRVLRNRSLGAVGREAIALYVPGKKMWHRGAFYG